MPDDTSATGTRTHFLNEGPDEREKAHEGREMVVALLGSMFLVAVILLVFAVTLQVR